MARSNGLESLEALRSDVGKAANRVRELEAERLTAARSVDRVQGPLRDYYRALELGERKPNRAEEKRLSEALRKASDTVTVSPRVANGRVTGIEIHDEEIEARLAAARERVTACENAVHMFIRDHASELQAEMTDRADASREALFNAWAALEAAIGGWSRVRAEWSQMLPQWGISPAELPANPIPTGEIESSLAPLYAGAPRDPRRFWPMPSSLVPGDWEEMAREDQEKPLLRKPGRGDLSRMAERADQEPPVRRIVA